MATEAEILDAVAAIALPVSGLNPEAVYSLGGGSLAGVKDLPDDIAMNGLPAFVVTDGGTEIIPGSWERTTWTLEGAVWAEYGPARGERTRQLLNLREPLRAAYRAHARGGLADDVVSSVLVTSTGAIEARQWRRGDAAPWYLVLPFSIEVKVNRAVTYVPA